MLKREWALKLAKAVVTAFSAASALYRRSLDGFAWDSIEGVHDPGVSNLSVVLAHPLLGFAHLGLLQTTEQILLQCCWVGTDA